MTDLTVIPLETLEKDLKESIEDIQNCERALFFGVTTYSGGSVVDRLRDNKGFVEVITKELSRRSEGEDVS